MSILKKIQKVPAGILLVPTIIGAVIHTFCPQILNIGDPTNVMFTKAGMQGFIGLLLFFTGTQMLLEDIKKALKRGVMMCIVKYIIAYGVSYFFLKIFGLNGILGVSFLAFAITMTSSNGALFMGIIQPYADQADYATFGLLMMFSMPVLPMLFLNSANGGQINYVSIISLLVPFIFGIVLGNLDHDFKKMFASGNTVILPFIGFQFGSLLNIYEAAKQIPTGILLTVIFYIVSIPLLYFFDRKGLKQPGYASLASVSVAGVALSIPSLAADASAQYAPFVQNSIAQLALVMIATTFITPFLTDYVMKKRKVPEKTLLTEEE